MLCNLLIGIPTMVACLLLQALLLVAVIRYYSLRREWLSRPSALPALVLVAIVMTGLVVGNVAQVAIWALVFRLLGEFSLMEVAIYHSAVNFTSLGYGDIVMSERHRLLGPLESINGMLMIGISTAAMMAAVQDALRRVVEARSRYAAREGE